MPCSSFNNSPVYYIHQNSAGNHINTKVFDTSQKQVQRLFVLTALLKIQLNFVSKHNL